MSRKRSASRGPVQRKRSRGLGRSPSVARQFGASIGSFSRQSGTPRFRNVRTGGYEGMELKFKDNEVALMNLANTWGMEDPVALNTISGVSQGDGENQRDGRVYNIHGLNFQGQLRQPALSALGVAASDVIVRIIIALDKQTNTAQMAATDLMEPGVLSTDLNSLTFRKLENTQRFRVLMDKRIRLNVADGQTAIHDGVATRFAHGEYIKNFAFYHKFATPIRVNTSGTTDSVGSINDNSIHVMAVSTEGANFTQLAYVSRLRFTG